MRGVIDETIASEGVIDSHRCEPEMVLLRMSVSSMFVVVDVSTRVVVAPVSSNHSSGTQKLLRIKDK